MAHHDVIQDQSFTIQKNNVIDMVLGWNFSEVENHFTWYETGHSQSCIQSKDVKLKYHLDKIQFIPYLSKSY